MNTDCLIIGFNDSDFFEFVEMVRSMGESSGAFRDLNLAFIDFEGKPHRSMDILNRFYFGDAQPAKPFNNTDFLWPTILYLGTYLSRRGFSFDFINQYHFEKEALREKLLHDDILTIAITTTLYVSPHPILEIISFVRRYNDRVKIVVGGPYVSNQAKMLDRVRLEQQLRFMGADFYVIADEGEFALASLLAALKAGASFDSIDNLAYRSGHHYVFTASSVERNPLEDNMIDYSLFSRESIGEFVSVRTAKSCPFSCSFCGFPQRAGKYTYLPVELVERELNTLCDLGVTTVTFLDDTFNVPKTRFKELLQMMIRNKYGFKWNSFYRSDHGDEETVRLMAKSGCEGVFLGIESGSDEMLTRMNKTSRRHNYMQAIPWLQGHGISVQANFIVGFPGETWETVQASISLIEETKPDFHRAQLWYCDPVTPIWNERDKYGVKGSAFHWTHDTMDHQTACDLVDRIFLCMENSIWLPQNGFEDWSTFYLQRKGMSLERIKMFLRFFNAAIREKLVHRDGRPISPALMEGLRRGARFNEPYEEDRQALQVFSGARYVAAEIYWLQEFRGAPATPVLDSIRDTGGGEKGLLGVDCSIERSTVEQLLWVGDGDLAVSTLAAFSYLLSRLSVQATTTIVARLEGQSVPLRLAPAREMTFEELVGEVARKTREAAQHALHAFPTLTNPWRLGVQGVECPLFEAGYLFDTAPESREGSELENLLGSHATTLQPLRLILKATAREDDLAVRLLGSASHFSREAMARFAESYSEILKEVAENPGAPLAEVHGAGSVGTGIRTVAREAFNV